MNLPTEITYEELGHEPDKFPAFSPDYVLEDIGKSFDLTITLFGYQLGSEEVEKLIVSLSEHLAVNNIHNFIRG